MKKRKIILESPLDNLLLLEQIKIFFFKKSHDLKLILESSVVDRKKRPIQVFKLNLDQKCF
jgi:hypothetical protein